MNCDLSDTHGGADIPSGALAYVLYQGIHTLAVRGDNPLKVLWRPKTWFHRGNFMLRFDARWDNRLIFHPSTKPNVAFGFHPPGRLTYEAFHAGMSCLSDLLPGFEVVRPATFGNEVGKTMKSAKDRYVVDRNALLESFKHTEAECFLAPLQKAIEWTRRYEQAKKIVGNGEDESLIESCFLSSCLEEERVQTPYFSIHSLPNFIEKTREYPVIARSGIADKISAIDFTAAANEISRAGVTSVAFMNGDDSRLSFYTKNGPYYSLRTLELSPNCDTWSDASPNIPVVSSGSIGSKLYWHLSP